MKGDFVRTIVVNIWDDERNDDGKYKLESFIMSTDAKDSLKHCLKDYIKAASKAFVEDRSSEESNKLIDKYIVKNEIKDEDKPEGYCSNFDERDDCGGYCIGRDCKTCIYYKKFVKN